MVAATQQAIEGNARQRAHEQAVVDRGTAAHVHEGGPMPPLDALRVCEAADGELRTRLASLLRRRAALAAEHRVAEIAVLEAECAEADISNAERRQAIAGLTARIDDLERQRG